MYLYRFLVSFRKYRLPFPFKNDIMKKTCLPEGKEFAKKIYMDF